MSSKEENNKDGSQQNTKDAGCDTDTHENSTEKLSQLSENVQASELQAGSSKESQYGQSVIVQNSTDLSIEGIDASLLKCIKQILASTPGQHSFMIVNGVEDDNHTGQEQTSFIIDLNSVRKQAPGPADQREENSYVEEQSSSTLGNKATFTATSLNDLSSADSSITCVLPESKLQARYLSESSPSSLGALDYQEQVEISFVSCPSISSLDDPANETEISHDPAHETVVSHENFSPQDQVLLVASQPQNHAVCVSATETLPKNLTYASQHQDKPQGQHEASAARLDNTGLSLHLPPSPTRPETLFSKTSLNTESHKTAEYLLHMAKKIIEETNQGKRLSLGQSGKIEVTPPHVEIEEKCGSESVITMYLSSPSQLQDKIQKLKTNSPVLVMQAGDTSGREENGSSKSTNEAKDCCTKIELSSRDMSPSSISSDQSSDSFSSAVTSLSSVGVVYRCAECVYSSHNKHYYKQHVDLVHSEDRPYKCPHCDYAGKRRHALLEHMVVHSNQRPFMCDHCNASFRKKGHLTNHIKLHTSQRLVHCGVCNIQLPDTEAFEAHLHKIHNTDKLYKCKLCDHTVVDRESMLRHLHTHNNSAIYPCPKCQSLFNNEDALLAHMRGNHEYKFVEGTAGSGGSANKASLNDDLVKPHVANMMCSECGFVCGNPEKMQQHMWVHIKQEDRPSVPVGDLIKISPIHKEEGNSNSSTMGVLKMNVDLGQKTLPQNVVYQCSNCSFTSSDNSVFIKHMLAHKTQEKRQRIMTLEQSKLAEGHSGQFEEKQSMSSLQYKPKPVSYYSDSTSRPLTQAKLESGVPFVYDKVSSRFRCVICGYHCEFQRTIKAHIWKHSGHQSIEYPTFDKHTSTTKATTAPPVVQVLANKPLDQKVTVRTESNIVTPVTGISNSQNMPVLRTRSGNTVQLVPINPLTSNYNPADLIQIKDNSVILPVDLGKNSTVSRYLESIAFSDSLAGNKKLIKVQESSTVSSPSIQPPPVYTAAKTQAQLTTCKSGLFSRTAISPSVQTHSTAAMEITEDDQQNNFMDSGVEMEKKCSEPSVVVEVMDMIPSSSGFTGMKSQQSSPRVLDLETSAGDNKSCKPLGRRLSGDSGTSLLENERLNSDKRPLKAVQAKDVDAFKNLHSYSARLRCPICDCLLTEDFKTHLLNCQKNNSDDKKYAVHVKKAPILSLKRPSNSYEHDDAENPQAEDTDSLESSDETTMSSTSSSQQKSGICSSLLAVIEQLRERSRSESEEDKLGVQILKKGGKKKGRQDDDDADVESVDDLQNIEKIIESGGEKFRCSLCHYTSHRICNIKLHMKTHRQKKPSECSLCDFSSSSPEALQEHMLKHCKVRTYACKFCPQSFNHKSTLRAHLRAHKDQEPFLCAYCVFETTNPMEYREHMQVHSGCSSRLRCPGCDLILSSKEELMAHLLKCKGSTKKAKPLRETSTKSDVEQEDESEKVETELLSESGAMQHACVVRGCAFSSSSLKELQEHLSIHCNPSLLVCNLCDFKALHSRSLKSHMKRHANDQRYVQQPLEQYKCNLCGYVCHHLPSLKSHMWRHASDQSYSYEFTNEVINAAIDHDTRVDADGEADDPLDRVINSERKILEGELTKCSKEDGQRPICWVTFRCCSCGFETINKAKLNIHMRTHSDIIQKALDIPRKPAGFQAKTVLSSLSATRPAGKRSHFSGNTTPAVPVKLMKTDGGT